MSGYSGTPLVQKLGIKADHRVLTRAAPKTFSSLLGALPPGAKLTTRGSGPWDVVVLFVTEREVLEASIGELRKALQPAGGLWVAWPKKASGVKTDMTEDVVRDVALPLGLVDNKVCAIDETWSGLRCVIRKELR